MTHRTNAVLWLLTVAVAHCPNLAADDRQAKADGHGFSTVCQRPDRNAHAGFTVVHSDTAFGSRAVDSFVSPGVERVIRVLWWGTYVAFVITDKFAPCVPKTDSFTLIIYADAGGTPGEILSTNEFGDGVIRYQTGEIVLMAGIELPEYAFVVALLEPFTAEAGETYWVEIVRDAFDVDGCTWWWETAPPGETGDGSALWDEGLGEGYQAFNFDLAVCIRLQFDCNRNGIPDDIDISDGNSSDCNGTAVPDECEAIGDYNGDGNVDLDDYAQWDACLTGPNAGPLTLGCESFDLDTDIDVDLLDFALFQVLFGCP